jgi:hypothetical protein
MVAASIPGGRQLVANSIARADEPGEAIAFWMKEYGRKMPKPVKRGIADALEKLYNERSLLKYDTASHGVRFADVIQLVHPKPDAPWRSDLYKHAMDRRYGNTEAGVPETLRTVQANIDLRSAAPSELSAEDIKAGGLTWENTVSRATTPEEKRAAWEAQIPSMGYMALLRNLRNFDEAGISQTIADQVIAKLSEPSQVARSRQFPFRFLSAFDEAGLRWAWTLEQALNLAVRNIPELPGTTLVLVDRSGSMFRPLSDRSARTWADAAALFGTALALRSWDRATLVQFGHASMRVNLRNNDSILRVIQQFTNLGGTETAAALQQHYRKHDRVVVITDEQHQGWNSPDQAIPADIPMYTFNLAGYRVGSMSNTPTRVTLGGGLTDAAFKVIPLLEAGKDGTWPWEEK